MLADGRGQEVVNRVPFSCCEQFSCGTILILFLQRVGGDDTQGVTAESRVFGTGCL